MQEKGIANTLHIYPVLWIEEYGIPTYMMCSLSIHRLFG